MKSKFYVTTPIYYVNDKPHIGHAYTTILADVLARFHREAGDDVFFLTGLDEHGQKVQQAAEKRGISPQEHCDDMAVNFLDLWEKLHIRYDNFIRTTEDRHEKVVESVLKKVYDAGDIYFDEYGGYYCVGCERFYTEKELEDGKCPQHQTELKVITEKNYFFRMSKYQQKLIDHIRSHPDFLQPEHRKNEILGFLRQPLEDLCISRPKSRLNWGIELPFDKDYVTYVWFDALLNYVTGPGYGTDQNAFEKWWSVCIHLIGKDILMTHAIYWPTMLMSAGIDLPQTIFAHGWWLTRDTKMSKSLGNVVNPMELIDQYGVDPVRYYLMREMVLGQDANFTIESFVKRYNSDLANDFGNLLNRVTKLIQRNFDGAVPEYLTDPTDAETAMKAAAEKLVPHVNKLINNLRINEAIEEILQFIRGINRYMEHKAPWKLVKTDLAAAGRVLGTAAEALRFGAVLLSPVMPNRCKQVLSILGAEKSDLDWGELKTGTILGKHGALFPRIDTKSLEKPAPKKAEPTHVATYADFEKVELRTAKILTAERVPDADKLLRLTVDLGSEQRQIVAGIARHYEPESLPGKTVIIVANLEPATIRGLKSEGMLLAAEKGKKMKLVTVDDNDQAPGARVF